MTITYDARVAARRAGLTKLRAERKDELDLPGIMTQRERSAYLAATAQLDATIVDFESKVAAWAALSAAEPDEKWLAFLNSARETLCDELLMIKSPIRDRAIKERADALTWSIRLIDFGFGAAALPIVTLAPTPLGQLMQAAGYETQGEGLRGPRGWRGGLPEVEARVKALTKQRAAAEAALDPLLLDEAERATADAEHDAYRAALKTMRVQGNAAGTGLIAYDPATDEPLDAEAMSDVQRRALAWFEAAAFPPREVASSEVAASS